MASFKGHHSICFHFHSFKMALILCNYGLVLSLLIFSYKQTTSHFKHLQ